MSDVNNFPVSFMGGSNSSLEQVNKHSSFESVVKANSDSAGRFQRSPLGLHQWKSPVGAEEEEGPTVKDLSVPRLALSQPPRLRRVTASIPALTYASRVS